MDLKEIKQIVDLMKRSSLTEFEIEEEGLKMRICRSSGEQPVVVATHTTPPMPVAPAAAPAAPAAPPPAEDTGSAVSSPMVGTFYSAPSPDSADFVKVGDSVTPDTVLCIIEAMKVMNEIKAEASGVISEIVAKNGESVEFGQPLFKLK